MENNLKQLPERFSVYAKTLEEAKYIVQKQEELCGYGETESRNSYYRFCPNAVYDKYGKMDESYLGSSFNIEKEFTFEEFKSFFEKKEEFPIDDFCVTNNGNNVEVVDYLKSKGFDNPNDLSGINEIERFYGIKSNSITWYYRDNKFKTSYTLQQLKELDNMKERKIIGYKLLEKIEGYTTEVGSICKDPLYFALYKDHPKFEAVYEEEFKVGDWVTWKQYSNIAYRLIYLNSDGGFKVDHEQGNYIDCNIYTLCRKSTEEEIKKSQQKTINVNNTDIIIKKGSMFAVDKEFTLEYLQVIQQLFSEKYYTSAWNINVETVKLGCKQGFKKSDIDKIIDEYKKFNV